MAKYIISVKDKPFIFHNDEMIPLDSDKVYEVIEKKTDKRTIVQNSAMHKYFSLVAEALNDAGYSLPFVMNKKSHEKINKVFDWLIKEVPSLGKILAQARDSLLKSEENELDWNMITVKELLWKAIQKAILGKESTTLLKKDEIDDVYLNMNRLTASKFGIDIPFPSIESMIFKQNYEEK